MEIFNNEVAEVSYNSDLRLGKVTWKKQSENVHEYKQPFLVLLEFSKQNSITKFLSDTTNQGIMPTQFRKVFVSDILPQAKQTGLKVGASISSGDAVKRFYLNMILRTVHKYGIPYRIFSNQRSAINWLRDKDA